MILRSVAIGILALILILPTMASEPSNNIVDDLLGQYDAVKRVSCLVRRDTQQGKQKGRVLSRVFYEKPDKLHVETIAPFKRRIISNGETFYDVPERAPKGYAKPVQELDEKRLTQLRKIPGTAMDHLMQLRHLTPKKLDATANYPTRYAFQTGDQYIILHLDAKKRLTRIAFFNDSSDATARAVYTYSDFVHKDGASIPTLHQGTIQQLEGEFTEETRIENLQINGAIPPALFNPAGYFKKMDFTSDYQEVFGF